MRARPGKWNSRGLTLTEMLITVAILAVLFALAMIPLSRIQRDMRQTELDSKAEMIFMAVQNRMAQLQAAGQTEAYQTGIHALGLSPLDSEDGKYTKDDLSYVTSRDADDSAAFRIYPEGETDPALRDADWVIESDARSGSVYAVFYSEREMDYVPETFDNLRFRARRIREGASIGYYGGDSVGNFDTGELEPKVEVLNGERLLLKITCDMYGSDWLNFSVTIRDESGHSTGEIRLQEGEVDRVTPHLHRTDGAGRFDGERRKALCRAAAPFGAGSGGEFGHHREDPQRQSTGGFRMKRPCIPTVSLPTSGMRMTAGGRR